MAGQVLAATETTSSALAFIFYELAKNSSLQESVYDELTTAADNDNLETLKLLGAYVTEGLRFRPPVALTGSRVVPNGGIDILGYYIPAGTVVTTQSLSMSRQRSDLFPNYDVFDPARWLEEDQLAERRRLTAFYYWDTNSPHLPSKNPLAWGPVGARVVTWRPIRCVSSSRLCYASSRSPLPLRLPRSQ